VEKTMNAIRLWLPAAALIVAGCAGTHTKMLAEARAPVPVDSVRVYDARPAGAVDIAMLEAKSAMGFGTQGQRDAVVARLRREAARLGANGVLLLGGGTAPSPVGLGVGAGRYGSHGGVSVGGGIPTTQEHAHGVAIYVPPGGVPAED
jgi:hypothetical protein